MPHKILRAGDSAAGKTTATDVLRSRFLKHDPACPGWPDRDRLVLAAGPFDPGLGEAAGLALAERMLAARYNRPGAAPLVDHRTYVLASALAFDGDLAEGSGDEAAALAGELGLGRLVVLYEGNGTDDNRTDGNRTSVTGRFAARGWHVQRVEHGGDPAVEAALRAAIDEESRPSLIAVRTRTGYVPAGGTGRSGDLATRGAVGRENWEDRLSALRAADPGLAAEWDRTQAGALPDGLGAALPEFEFAPAASLATSAASGEVLGALARAVPELVGVREHAMGAILNGVASHGGLRAFGGTSLVFSGRMRPAIRRAALMRLPVTYVFTHDPAAVGEDGPAHQPAGHLAALRAIPGLAVIRPADANETTEAWETALRRTDGPTALILSRQPLPVLVPPGESLTRAGARVLHGNGTHPDVALVATGPEVSLALAAAGLLGRDGVRARVVSVPWRERFLACDRLDRILPPAVPRVVIEAGSPEPWRALAGEHGDVIGPHQSGACGPGPEVTAACGLSPDYVRAVAADAIARAAGA